MNETSETQQTKAERPPAAKPLWRPARLIGLVEGSLATTGDTCSCRVRFNADDKFFAGHFPARPVVPGVIMIEGLIALYERSTGTRRTLAHLIEAKFRSEAHPNDELGYVMITAGAEHKGEITCGGKEVLTVRMKLIDPGAQPG